MKTDKEIEQAPLNRLNDTFFKSAFASPERKHLTIAFLNALMSHVYSDFPEIEDVEFLDREFVPSRKGEKVPRFDVFSRATFKNREAKLFHIEVQDSRDKFFSKRSFYYACNDYVNQSKRGLSYEDFEPVVFLGLTDFLAKEPDKEAEWHNLHKVLNTVTHECKFDLMDLHKAELPLQREKWKKIKHKPSTKFEELMFYFGRVGGRKMEDTLVREIAESNPVVAELLDYEQIFRMDPLLWRQYVMDERAHIDYLENLKYEREEGIEIGLEKGRVEGREEGMDMKAIEIARNARAKRLMSDEEIADLVGLPLEVVKDL